MISELDTLFQGIITEMNTEDSTSISYLSKAPWEFNEDDKPDLPCIYIELPMALNTSFTSVGVEINRYKVNGYALINSDFEERQPTRTVKVDQAHAILKKFVNKLREAVEECNSVTISDTYYKFDTGMDGVEFTFDFTMSIPC